MTRRILALLATAPAISSCGAPAVDRGAAGTWAGELRHPRVVLPLEVVVDSTGRAGTISNRLWRLESAAATVGSRADSIEFVVRNDRDPIRFQGMLRGDRMVGEARRGDERADFELVRIDPHAEAGFPMAIGTYRTATGRLLVIAPFSEFGPRPMLVDYGSGRISPLLATGPTRLLVGQSVVAPIFPADTVELRLGGGQVAAIRFVQAGQAPIEAARLPTTDADLEFSNGPIRLAGTLTTPAASSPYPALVLVHGSNAQTRDAMGPWVRYFAGLGFAVLSFDKRGTGRSTGDWKEADFPALAADVLAGVRALAARPDIRPDRIGLWGISQAGWIMPLVAAAAPGEIAYLIVHAGTGTTVREQGILNYRNELRFGGLPEKVVALGVRFQILDDSVTKTGRGIDAVQRFYQEHRAEAPWLEEPAPVDAWFRGYYRMLMDFDPRSTWERITCPVLLFFGELDANVPPTESWPPIERALRKAGNQRVTQYLLPKANHVFFEAETGARDEYPRLRRFVAGYFDRMAQWLETNAR